MVVVVSVIVERFQVSSERHDVALGAEFEGLSLHHFQQVKEVLGDVMILFEEQN